MFTDAAREIRFHPGRVVATVIAIAISVAFMSGVSVFLETSRNAQANSTSIYLTNADLVLSPADETAPDEFDLNQAADQVAEIAGVEAVTVLQQEMVGLSSDTADIFATLYGPLGELAWNSLEQGRAPESASEVQLSKGAADKLGVGIGDEVTASGLDLTLTVVGISKEPTSTFGQSAYTTADSPALYPNAVLIKAASGTDLDALATTIQSALPDASVQTADSIRAQNLTDITAQFDVMGYVLQGFAVVSLLVGMIIIANTFNILLTQRRRQIGLLRAIGASSSQVQRKFLAEAILLGVIGSALGVGLGIGLGAVGAAFLDQLSWGIQLPPTGLVVAFIVGVVATIVAAVTPSLRATRVSPMEALQATPSAAQAKKITRTRWVVCILFGAAGAGLVTVALTASANNIVWAMAGSALLTVAVLGGAPIYVPLLIKGLGKLFSFGGPTVRLAAQNGARNPRRASATATALMLAVGLIVTLQVAVATVGATATAAMEARYPIDLSVTTLTGGIDQATQDTLAGLDGVELARAIPGTGLAESDQFWLGSYALAPGGAMAELAPNATVPTLTDDVAFVSELPEGYAGEKVTIKSVGDGEISVTLKASHFAAYNVLVSDANLEKLTNGEQPVTFEMWLKLTEKDQAAAVMRQMDQSVSSSEVSIGGSAFMSYIFGQVISTIMTVMSALMGVAVLIALVGVANTLGLSVLERKQESALLRALGMQRSSLRWMLTVEALFLAIVGTGVGVIAGAFFGWLGALTAFMMIQNTAGQTLAFKVDPLWTGGLILIAILAAMLASVLPGRRAAMATPTEALAVE